MQNKNNSIYKLSNIKQGRYYKISDISSDLPADYIRRLCELGFVCGEEIKIIRKSFSGKTFLVALKGYACSLRYDIVQNIFVEEI